jgi:transcriptional regulator with XRE-family HTH domain
MDIDYEMNRLGFEISPKRSGMSQKELAEKAGITQQQLSKIENGDNCNIYTLMKVCKALGFKLTLSINKTEEI